MRIHGTEDDIYFGDPEATEADFNWRAELEEDDEEDEVDDEEEDPGFSPEMIEMIGFDPSKSTEVSKVVTANTVKALMIINRYR